MKIEIDIVKRMLFVGGSKDRMTMIYASDVFPPEYSFTRLDNELAVERYVLFAIAGDYKEAGIYVEASLIPELRLCLREIDEITFTNFFNCVNKILKRREG